MKRFSFTMIFLALALLGQAESRGSAPKAATLMSFEPKISPPLHDVKSDKKFFGPPFPADYPEDKRPVPDKKILDKLKGPDQPYPALQSKEDFDADYVKDENSDKGSWQAQFEYDTLRRKLAQEEADERRAAERAAREGRDADAAQHDDDAAGRAMKDAEDAVNEAAGHEEEVKRAEDFDGPPSHEKLEELKKAVSDAEERYEQQKKAFEECKRQLEAAKKDLEDLKAKQVAMEEQLAADTKLWAEQKAVKLNLKKTKQSAAAEKVKAAKDKVAAAEKVKADADKKLAKEKAESEKAKNAVQKEKAEMEKVKKQIAEAQAKLQKLHGYKPAQVAPTEAKSGAHMTSVLISLLTVTAVQML